MATPPAAFSRYWEAAPINYFEFHIGDYVEATSHLTFLEDAAYFRLVRKYYAKEEPLPVDVKAVQRLIGARNRGEERAVESVLNEFFRLEADGWHNDRCDEVIQRYKEGEPERELKASNTAARTRRHREERAQLFADLGSVGQHPSFRVKIDDLRALHEQFVKRSPALGETVETDLKRVSSVTDVTGVDTLVTATHTHVPKSQFPSPKSQVPKPNESSETRVANGVGTGALQPEAIASETDPPRPRVSLTADQVREHWLEVEAIYPDGSYGREQFLIGERDYGQRIADGFPWGELKAAVVAMADQKRATGKIGTQYVWSPGKFFGPDPELPGRFIFQREFRLPKPVDKLTVEREQRLTRNAAELQVLMEGRAARGLLDFRDPREHEDAATYATQLRFAEQERRGGPAGDVAALVAALSDAKRVAT